MPCCAVCSGLPIVLAALGSSIVSDFGGCFNQERVPQLSAVHIENWCSLNPTGAGFLSNVMDAINATW